MAAQGHQGRSQRSPRPGTSSPISQNDMGDNGEAETSAQKRDRRSRNDNVALLVRVRRDAAHQQEDRRRDQRVSRRRLEAQAAASRRRAGKLAKVLYEMRQARRGRGVPHPDLLQTDRNNAGPVLQPRLRRTAAQKKYKLAVDALREVSWSSSSKDDGLRKTAENEIKATEEEVEVASRRDREGRRQALRSRPRLFRQWTGLGAEPWLVARVAARQ